jgi:TPR repeat protein
LLTHRKPEKQHINNADSLLSKNIRKGNKQTSEIDGLTDRANAGDAEAQYSLWVYYDHGQGVPQNYTKAVYWYIKSAVQGNASAQCMLGNSYYTGQGVPQDYAKAAYWYIRSVE